MCLEFCEVDRSHPSAKSTVPLVLEDLGVKVLDLSSNSYNSRPGHPCTELL